MRNVLTPVTAGAVAVGLIGAVDVSTAQADTEIRWGTSSVGSAGHRALVTLGQVLDRELDGYTISVLPTPGAAATVRGFAAGEFEGYYGADVAFHEIAGDYGRYQGFLENAGDRELVQSFWTYTLEVGLGVRAEDADDYAGWRDLSGAPVFTSPAPWDTRAALERAMDTLEVGHDYIELDTGLAGQSLQEGTIDAFIVYTAGLTSPAPWVQEAMLTTDVRVLNPSDEEIAALEEAGIGVTRISADVFDADIGVDEAIFVPFYYGYHVGLEMSADDVYAMLVAIEENVDEIAESDPGLSQLRDDMVGIQVGGIEAVGDAARIHPGLARFLQEHDAWNDEWDDRIAE